MTKTVLVLGGSLGGLAVVHRLLKYTLPQEKDLKVILVSKNSHFYWNIASVRAVIPGVVKDEELLQPIRPGLEQYPAESVEFVVGTATQLDRDAKTVQVTTGAGASHRRTTRAVPYDHLVIATGAQTADPGMPWKAAGTHDECLASLHDTAARIKEAQNIVVVGGGPTGVEVAAEIRYEFRNKDVILLSGDEALVGGDSTAAAVEGELLKIGVDVRKGVRAGEITPAANGRTEIALSNGETIVTDLYLPTTGVVPNTAFLPSDVLTERGFVHVDDCLRVVNAEDAWALGDAISKPRSSVQHTEAQAATVARNITAALKGEALQPTKEPLLDAFLFSIGRKRGAGRVNFVPAPSFTVWMVKGRTLGMERTPKYVNGTMW